MPKPQLEIHTLIKKQMEVFGESLEYLVFDASPAVGVLYIHNNFLSGQMRLRGKKGGRYPFKYLEMIDALFGQAAHTVEVCSGTMKGDINTTTVDIHMGKTDDAPDVVCDAETLNIIGDEKFDRWRADPPYNEEAARKMYHCKMPSLARLLKAGARVVHTGSLLFLLCQQNYQICPHNLKRIGCIFMTIVPNNELRVLNIYYKVSHDVGFWGHADDDDNRPIQLRFDQIAG